MSAPKFTKKNGSLTPYAFACGYIETRKLKTEGGVISLSLDGCWHVQARDDSRGRFLWECFDSLTEARKFFRKSVK